MRRSGCGRSGFATHRHAAPKRARVAEPAPVAVQSLGRFRVFRDGTPVPLTAWQSRKARDLLKILVARRGRPTPRDALMEALWPDQSPGPLGNRLSVLLSTVRSVLDPDKRHEADHFVAADRNAIWLQRESLSIDVEEFLGVADASLALARDNDPEAHSRLVAAESSYLGDFLEEDAYEDWAVGLREETRAIYTEVVRALARGATAHGDADAATRYHLRVLERDPYDEPAHLGLVTALEAAGTARRGAAVLPSLLLADGRDRSRVSALPDRRANRDRRGVTPL